MPKKYILLVLGLIISVTIGTFVVTRGGSNSSDQQSHATATKDSSSTAPDTTTALPQTPNYIRIAALGDMLPHDTVNLRAKTTTGYDYLPFFSDVNKYVDESDIVFCNQESPSAGEGFGISGYPTFNAPLAFPRDLQTFGCNVINLANNHVADKGQAGIDKTIATWQSLKPLAFAGANSSMTEQNQVRYFETHGKKFAFIAFTDLTNNKAISNYSINMFSTSLVTKLAKQAAANADYVIASAHWGVEDSPDVSKSQRGWAKLMADNGVDLIIGTGPHVLQPIDKIGDTVIFYSIGNFLSTQLQVEELVGGIAYIDIPIDGGDPRLSFLPTFMNYTWTAQEANTEDFLKRDNLSVNPLYKSATLIKASLFETTADAQQARVEKTLNTNTPIKVLSSD